MRDETTTPERALSHEAQAELDAFRDHLTHHRPDSVPDCPFCTQRDARKATPPAPPDHLPTDDVLSDVLIVDGACQECRDEALCGFHGGGNT